MTFERDRLRIEGIIALPDGGEVDDRRFAERALDVFVVVADQTEIWTEISQDLIDVLTTDIVSLTLKQTVWRFVCKENVDLEFHHALDVLSDKVTSAVILEFRTTLVLLRGGVDSGEPSDSNTMEFDSGTRKEMHVRRAVRVASGSKGFDDVEILVVAGDEPRREWRVVVQKIPYLEGDVRVGRLVSCQQRSTVRRFIRMGVTKDEHRTDVRYRVN